MLIKERIWRMWKTNTERIFNNPEKLLLSKQKKKEVEKLKLENKY